MMKAPRLIGVQFFPTQQVEAPEADEERLAVSVVRTSVGRSRLPHERLVLRPHIRHDVATYTTTHGGLPDESASADAVGVGWLLTSRAAEDLRRRDFVAPSFRVLNAAVNAAVVVQVHRRAPAGTCPQHGINRKCTVLRRRTVVPSSVLRMA